MITRGGGGGRRGEGRSFGGRRAAAARRAAPRAAPTSFGAGAVAVRAGASAQERLHADHLVDAVLLGLVGSVAAAEEVLRGVAGVEDVVAVLAVQGVGAGA